MRARTRGGDAAWTYRETSASKCGRGTRTLRLATWGSGGKWKEEHTYAIPCFVGPANTSRNPPGSSPTHLNVRACDWSYMRLYISRPNRIIAKLSSLSG